MQTAQIILSLSPDFITPSGNANLGWEITGISLDEHTLALRFTLPHEITPEEGVGTFDPSTQILTIPVTETSGNVKLYATECLSHRR